MRLYLLSAIFTFLSLSAWSQDQPVGGQLRDSSFRKKDTTKHSPDSTYHVDLTASGAINRTTSDITYLFNNDLKFGLKKKSISLSFDNNWVYGTDHHALTNNDYASVLQFNLYKSIPHFFYWGLANYNTSYSLKVNSQFWRARVWHIAYGIKSAPILISAMVWCMIKAIWSCPIVPT